MRVTNFIIGFILLTLTTLVTNSFASIGEVTIHNGSAVIDRQDGDKDIEVEKQLDVFSYDTVKTGQGQVGIKFVDDTRVDVTAHSKLIIDEFVYDPSTNTGKLSLKSTLGTVRYAIGQIDKNSEKNFLRSAQNIKNIKVINEEGANIYDMLKFTNIIITSSSMKKIENRILDEKN